MIVLGIETSCDETSAAVIQDGLLKSNVVLSQEIHREFGGVVPEIASREHEEQLTSIIELALKRASVKKTDLDAIAVTYGAGLMGALLVGLNIAKGLAIGLDIPFLGVNHMEGHLFANMIDNSQMQYPFLCMLVSGGHTQIWQVDSFGEYILFSTTVDDAAGEAFDKGARILGLNYPGGPEIQRESKGGNPSAYRFPRPRLKRSELDFSFSGLKTAILYTCKKMTSDEILANRADIAASYQEAIIDTLLEKLKKVHQKTNIHKVSVAGGVAANSRFREKAYELSEKMGLDIHFPKMELCTDNAAMIAMAGYERLKSGERSSLDLPAIPNLSLAG
ncbi:MAG: tRNA (adenosine(37)-N6)-threonylcarbamoyltransferase complex transferase subunit TsaD [Candidatus Marinimicrobia bacterium]|nr:tRNA (adenosine(37)-N6)-threonylcarbamoyltransferase complex transferase subunit TsaD [Candidatus Neomarinimicrobiota bacterium]